MLFLKWDSTIRSCLWSMNTLLVFMSHVPAIRAFWKLSMDLGSKITRLPPTWNWAVGVCAPEEKPVCRVSEEGDWWWQMYGKVLVRREKIDIIVNIVLLKQIASLCCNPRKIGMFLNLERCFRYQDLRMISLSSLIITFCSDKSSTMIAQRNKWKAEQSNFQTLWQAESSQCISACETESRD